MSDSQVDSVPCDVAVVGGGLAGGLIALALQRARPEFRIRVIEAGRTIGGNHRWSWFDSDLSEEGRALLAGFRQTDWEGGYEVRFPKYRRKLKTAYRSMASSEFHEGLMRALPEGSVVLGRKAVGLDAHGVDLGPSQYGPAERVPCSLCDRLSQL